jgi:hypothetical protein
MIKAVAIPKDKVSVLVVEDDVDDYNFWGCTR